MKPTQLVPHSSSLAKNQSVTLANNAAVQYGVRSDGKSEKAGNEAQRRADLVAQEIDDRINNPAFVVAAHANATVKEVVRMVGEGWNSLTGSTEKNLPSDAQEDFRRMAEANPQAVWERHDRGRKHFADNNNEQAILDFKSVLEVRPDAKWVRYDMGFSYSKLGFLNEAIEQFLQEKEINPAPLAQQKCNYELGVAYDKLGNLPESLKYFRDAVFEDAPDQVMVNTVIKKIPEMEIQQFLTNLKNAATPEETLMQANSAIEKYPEGSAEFYRYRGEVYKNDQKYLEAINDFTSGLKINERAPNLNKLTADCYMGLKQYQSAIDSYLAEQEINYNPDCEYSLAEAHMEAHFLESVWGVFSGNFSKTMFHLKQAEEHGTRYVERQSAKITTEEESEKLKKAESNIQEARNLSRTYEEHETFNNKYDGYVPFALQIILGLTFQAVIYFKQNLDTTYRDPDEAEKAVRGHARIMVESILVRNENDELIPKEVESLSLVNPEEIEEIFAKIADQNGENFKAFLDEKIILPANKDQKIKENLIETLVGIHEMIHGSIKESDHIEKLTLHNEADPIFEMEGRREKFLKIFEEESMLHLRQILNEAREQSVKNMTLPNPPSASSSSEDSPKPSVNKPQTSELKSPPIAPASRGNY